MSFFKRIFSSEKKETLDKGLEQTKTSFFSKLTKAVAGKSKVDDEVLDNLEEVLVSSDVGVNTTLKIIERIEARVAQDKYLGTDELNQILREEIAALLSETQSGEESEFTVPANKKPYVIMVVGIIMAGIDVWNSLCGEKIIANWCIDVVVPAWVFGVLFALGIYTRSQAKIGK
jgi:fused signal recognition particle receptor